MKLPDQNRGERRAGHGRFHSHGGDDRRRHFFHGHVHHSRRAQFVTSRGFHFAQQRPDGRHGGRAIVAHATNWRKAATPGNFSDIPVYEGYRWISQTTEAATNGLFQVEIAVINPGGKPDSVLTVLFYRPDSQTSHLGLH